MAWETMEAVDKLADSPFLATQWLPKDFVRGEVFLFVIAGNTYVTVYGVQHRVVLPVITAIS